MCSFVSATGKSELPMILLQLFKNNNNKNKSKFHLLQELQKCVNLYPCGGKKKIK